MEWQNVEQHRMIFEKLPPLKRLMELVRAILYTCWNRIVQKCDENSEIFTVSRNHHFKHVQNILSNLRREEDDMRVWSNAKILTVPYVL